MAGKQSTSPTRSERSDLVSGTDGDEVWHTWREAVNMTAQAARGVTGSEESKSVGQSEDGGEATGHESGRRIVEVLRSRKHDLGDSDVQHSTRSSAMCIAI